MFQVICVFHYLFLIAKSLQCRLPVSSVLTIKSCAVENTVLKCGYNMKIDQDFAINVHDLIQFARVDF